MPRLKDLDNCVLPLARWILQGQLLEHGPSVRATLRGPKALAYTLMSRNAAHVRQPGLAALATLRGCLNVVRLDLARRLLQLCVVLTWQNSHAAHRNSAHVHVLTWPLGFCNSAWSERFPIGPGLDGSCNSAWSKRRTSSMQDG